MSKRSNQDEWANAFLMQAREDFVAARRLLPQENEHEIQAPSVFVMLLQMVIEKTGKAICLKTGALTKNHKQHPIAMYFLPFLKRAQIGRSQHIANWPDIQRIIKDIESALPAREGNRPQLEYPWESSSGVIGCPAKDLPIAQSMTDPQNPDGAKLIKFLVFLHNNFDALTVS